MFKGFWKYFKLNLCTYWGNSIENGALIIEAKNDGRGNHANVVVLKSNAAVIIDAPELIKHGTPRSVIVDSNNRVQSVYNDLAEMMLDPGQTAPWQTAPGDVCIWDEAMGGIRRAAEEDDPRVVGVHSDSYGFILGINPEEAEQYSPIGLAGQVWVKAKGVKVGDLLTTSSEPGVAKTSTKLVPGSIFAKALESAPGEEVKRIRALIMVR